MSRMRILIGAVLALGLVAVVVWALRPEPLAVDLAEVQRGPMQVTLNAEGITRVRDPHVITAPISGTTTRSPVQVGDSVAEGETVVAILQPAAPELMDARTRAQAEAAIAEAEAGVEVARTNRDRAASALEHAQREFLRGEGLALAGTIPQRMLDDLTAALDQARQNMASAEAELSLRLATLRRAEAQLVGPDSLLQLNGQANECCVQLHASITGMVLDVTDRNARQVTAGTPLVTLGDITDLEIEVDLLSTDALRVRAGTAAQITRWGGEEVLEARVRRIEPAAFTRVSALGIEEQRVRVQLDLLSPPDIFAGLGEKYRVQVDLIVWESEDALHVPHGALFRDGDGWAVFRVEEDQARLTPVTPGHRGATQVELRDGLEEGAQVVLFPPNALTDGTRIVAR